MFAALLDTCVLWPSLQRDVLLSWAIEDLYRPLWSSAILDELVYHEERKLAERLEIARSDAERRALRLIATMRSAFSDAEVAGWEELEGLFGLPDADDEHVLAAAVAGGANVIVTHNLKDFPTALVPDGIKVQAPAEFARHMVTIDPAAGLRAIGHIAARSGRNGPQRTVDEVLELLVKRYGFDEAVAVLRVGRDDASV